MAQGYVPDLLGEWLRAQDAVQQKRQFEMQQQQVADAQARDAQLRSLGPTVFPQSPELQAVWQADPRLASSIYGQQREFDLKKAMLDAKEAAASVTGDNVGNVNPGDFEPQSIAAWLKSGNSPSTRDYSLLRRVWAPVAPSVANFGGVPGLVGRDPNRGGAGAAGNVTPLATPAVVAGNAGAITAAETAARGAAESAAAARANLPIAQANADQMLALLDRIQKHPGKSYAVGKSSVLPIVPGTDAADFNALLEQAQGRQFLEAYNSLKGSGSITEVEGRKAEQAIANLSRAQSEKGFNDAINNLREVVIAGRARAEAKANGGVPPAVPPPSKNVQARKTVGNKTYVKIDGQWYEE